MALELNYTSADFGLAFQHHVLAVFLTHAAAMRRFRSIFDPLLFEDPIDQRIGECLLSVYDEAKALPTRATLEQVIRTSTKDKSLRAECIERAEKYYKRRSEDAEFVLNRVREFSKVRAVANAVITSARDVESNHLPNILPRMRAALSVGDDLSDTGVDYLKNLPRRNKLRKQGKLQPPTISTGFPHFDYALRGGCSKGQFVFAIASAKKGKCVSADARIWTPDAGYVRMADLEVGRRVLGITTDRSKPTKTEVTNKWGTGRKEIAEIHLRSGRIIKGLAGTHPVRTRGGWTKVEDLLPGDVTVGAAVLPLSGCATQQEAREAYAVGVFLGDGGLTLSYPAPHSHATDDDAVIAATMDALPCTTQVRTRVMGNAKLTSFHADVRDWLVQHGIKYGSMSKDKTVPRWVYKKGAEAVAACLAGLFDTDGSVYTVRKGQVNCEIALASYDMSEDILTMLNCLGIYATRRRKIVKLGNKRHVAWPITLRDERSLATFLKRVGRYGHHHRKWSILRDRTSTKERSPFYSRLPADVWAQARTGLAGVNRWTDKNCVGMAEHCGNTAISYSQRVHDGICRGTRCEVGEARAILEYVNAPVGVQDMARGDLVFDEVVEVKWVGSHETFDISTALNTQSFLCEHVFTHNSIFLLNLALGAVRAGQRVLYVSLELNDEDVQTRMDMRLAGPKKYVLAKDDPDAFADYITNRAKTTFTGALHVKYYPAKTVTCTKLTALMDALRAEGANIDVLVVDHADLMVAEDVSRQASRSEKEGQAYLELKALAQTQDVLVYTACQANKGAAGKESVEAVDAAWSYEKIAHCDLAVSINQTRDEAKEKLARISIVAARRHESNVNVEVKFDPSCYYMASTRLYDGFMSRIPTSFDKDTGGSEKSGFRTVSKLKEKLQENADEQRRNERPPKQKVKK